MKRTYMKPAMQETILDEHEQLLQASTVDGNVFEPSVDGGNGYVRSRESDYFLIDD